MSVRKKLIFAIAASAALTSVSGCTASSAQMREEMALTQMRVEELEHSNRQLQVRLDAYEASITLVEDQVQALEVGQRRGGQHELEVVRIEPGQRPSGQYDTRYYGDSYETATHASSSNTYDSATYGDTGYGDAGYADPSYGDAGYDDAGYDDAGYGEEIVINDDKLEKYFGHEKPAPKAKYTGPRVAKAPVVTNGDRLPLGGKSKGAKLPAKKAKPSASGDPMDMYKVGLKHYRQQDFQAGIEHFDAFLAANPPADYVDNALYWLGECHYGLKDYATAAEHFHRIVKEYPEANKVPDALLKVGLTYQRLDKGESAKEVLYYLIEAYPDTEAARVAKKKLEKSAS